MKQNRNQPLQGDEQPSQDPKPQTRDQLLHDLQVHQIELKLQNEELRQAQQDLEALNARLIDLFELAPVGYLVLSRKGLILEANLTAAGLLGVARSALILQPLSLFILPEDQDIFYHHRHLLFESAVPQECELRILQPQADPIWSRLQGSFTQGEDSEPVCCIAMSDISDRKRAEVIALVSAKLASIGNLAAGMAHEINSPLQLVTGLSERLARDLNADRIDKQQFLTDLENINKNGWRISRIVRSLLTYAHQGIHEMAPQQLNAIIESTLLLIEHQLASWSNISIEKELTPDLPLIHADSNSLTQVILNLLENARDAMPDGGWIKISTAASRNDGQVVLQISDSGVGIPEEIQSHIFDPFFTTKEVGKGTGLGLSIVHGIIQVHGGEIEVKTLPGKGTTFTICLPEKPPSVEEKHSPGRY
jgi:PAS domain S-box-containing protein